MRSYPTNSPESLARLVALAILADGRLHNQEIDWIREHDTASLIGVDQDTLVQVLLDCCRDLLEEGGSDRLDVLSEARLAPLAEEISDVALRKVAVSAVLVVAKSDGRLSSEEQTLLRFSRLMRYVLDTLRGNHRLVRQMARESPHFLVDDSLAGLAAKMNALTCSHDVDPADAYESAGITPLDHRVFLRVTDNHGGRRIEAYSEIVPVLSTAASACK